MCRAYVFVVINDVAIIDVRDVLAVLLLVNWFLYLIEHRHYSDFMRLSKRSFCCFANVS